MDAFLESRQAVLPLGRPVHSGGEGDIYRLADQANRCIKIVRNPHTQWADKLQAMLVRPPANPSIGGGYVEIAWPLAAVYATEADRRPIGYEMMYAAGTQSLGLAMNGVTRPTNLDFAARLRLARNVAWGVDEVHRAGHVIGDLQPDNLVIFETFVTFTDVDSYQIRDGQGAIYRCLVARTEYTAPELQGCRLEQVHRHPHHDAFALAVIAFQLLMEGNHPFSARYSGPGRRPSLVQKIRKGCFPYADPPPRHFQPRPAAPPFEVLHPELQILVRECFQHGHHDPGRRPTPDQWKDSLNAALSDPHYLQHAEQLLEEHRRRCGSPGSASSPAPRRPGVGVAGSKRGVLVHLGRHAAKAVAGAARSALPWAAVAMTALAAMAAMLLAGNRPSRDVPHATRVSEYEYRSAEITPIDGASTPALWRRLVNQP